MDATNQGALVLAHKNYLPLKNMSEIAVMGDFCGRSNMFGAKNQAEGIMVVGICQQEGWSYADFMANFDIIKGKLSKKPAAMLADFKQRGGSYVIVQRDSEGSIIDFKKDKQTFRSSCLWVDVQKEPLPYDMKEADAVAMLSRGQVPPMKPKYATPRSRMQMLWARCVSDGLRAFDPACCKGIYTPEEVDDFVQSTPQSPTNSSPSAQTIEVPAQTADVSSIEVCPVGPAAGKRWDDESVFNVDTLKQALEGTHPLLTAEMKDYIRGLVEKRQPVAATVVEPEVVNG